MSRILLKVVAPLAVAAGIGSFAFLGSAPTAVQADISIPMQQGGVPSLAPMLKGVLPAVVNISVTAKQALQNPLMQDPFFRRFFGIPEEGLPQERESQSVGSGVIVDAAKGYVLTNAHVVEGADSIRVRLTDDREFEAKLIGADEETDVAVLQIDAKELKALTIADSDKAEVGDFVVAIGSPFGLRHTVTSGIVSAVGRSTGGAYDDFIQTDASINPGNSGGALVNLRGELIGINSQILSRTGGNIGIGFAIPTNLARSIMNQLIEYGSVQRGRIGIVGQDLTPELAKAFGLTAGRGAVVAQVVPGSPADKAGLKSEDVVLKANGKEIQNFAQLRGTVGLLRVGEKVDLEILREGKTRKVTVTVGQDSEQAAAGDELHPALAGARFMPLDDATARNARTQGVLVQAVEPRSPAARAGLRPNDIVIGINRQPVTTIAEFNRLAGVRGGELLVHVQRGSGALFLLIR
ncbi:MAG TPA: DegQ family serine endoprotease [Nevskiaceae bacterium]|nr:DegQ family serine endoprotease [Nevskiaceae bacterium]